jgi:GTPase SAR1 family protein
MDLSQVSDFGGIDADADELLRDCFQNHASYVAARNHKRFVIVGRKGSGKTSIFKRLVEEKDASVFSFGHTFEDYPWAYHDLQAESGVPEERRYIHSWKYLILLTLGKIVLNYDNSIPWDEDSLDAVTPLESFIVDSYGSRDPDVTQLFSPTKEIKLKGSLKIPLLTVDLERIRVQDLPVHFQEVNRQVGSHIMRALNPAHDYYICFDQLDLGFSMTDQSYSQRLIGLILAAREIGRLARDAGKRLSVVVFLRDDIYDSLHFEDKNKITENNVSRIEWKISGTGLTLKSLMERRFGEVLYGSGTAPWEAVFDEGREMPGRQRKYNYICDRTFLRPRDMIKFCNEILAAYQQDGSQNLLDNEQVLAARYSFSEYLLNELDDEIAKQAPLYKDYLEVLKSVGRMQFTSGQFNEAWSRRSELADKSSSEALRQLFEFSVVGYLKPGGGGGGSRYVWRYQDIRSRFNYDAETLRVHPGFKEVLDLVSGMKAK